MISIIANKVKMMINPTEIHMFWIVNELGYLGLNTYVPTQELYI